ncbi:MAG: TIGR02391 family protein [Nitrospiraceae bacterium]
MPLSAHSISKRRRVLAYTERGLSGTQLKAVLENRVVHAEVLNHGRAELLEENYFRAVFEVTKGVAQRIRLV